MSLDERSYGLDAAGNVTSTNYIEISELGYGVISGSGGIFGDHDYYAFLTQPGVTYTVIVTPTAFPGLTTVANPSPIFALRTSSGGYVDLSAYYSGSQVYVLNASSYGKFFIDIYGQSTFSTGGYYVSLSSNVADDYSLNSGAVLTLGYTHTGTLEQVMDSDWFTAPVVAGHSYFLQISSSTISDLFAVGKNALGQVMAFDRANSGEAYSITATSSEITYLGISSNSAQQTGNYSIFVQERANLAKTLTAGSPGNDSITYSDSVGREVWGWDGQDTISLGSGSDIVFGNDGADYINGGNGDDYINGGQGDDTVIGGGGSDTVAYSGNRAGYTITATAAGYTISSAADGLDTLQEVEFALFVDQTIALFPPDTTAPIVAAFSPADEATGVALTSNIVITFSEAIAKGVGSIVLRNAAGTVESFDAASSPRLTISGASLTINPTADLSYSTGYSVEFPFGAVKDLAGNGYAGTTSYNFITVADTVNPANETFTGTGGNESFTGGTGNDTIDGGAGLDTSIYSGVRAGYTTARTSSGYTVTDNQGTDGTDTLQGVERLKFSDGRIALDMGVAQAGGGAALLIGAVLGHASLTAKKELIGAVVDLFDQGFTLQQLSGAVMRLDVWGILAGGNSSAQIATYLLTTVNGAAPSDTALGIAVNSLTNDPQGDFLWHLAESSTNQIQVDLVGLATTGLEFVP